GNDLDRRDDSTAATAARHDWRAPPLSFGERSVVRSPDRGAWGSFAGRQRGQQDWGEVGGGGVPEERECLVRHHCKRPPWPDDAAPLPSGHAGPRAQRPIPPAASAAAGGCAVTRLS